MVLHQILNKRKFQEQDKYVDEKFRALQNRSKKLYPSIHQPVEHVEHREFHAHARMGKNCQSGENEQETYFFRLIHDRNLNKTKDNTETIPKRTN